MDPSDVENRKRYENSSLNRRLIPARMDSILQPNVIGRPEKCVELEVNVDNETQDKVENISAFKSLNTCLS